MFKVIFNEALKIVKKKSEKDQDILSLKAKETYGSGYVGFIKDVLIVKSGHTMEKRGNSTKSRDSVITTSKLIEVIGKLLKTPTFKDKVKVEVVYKDIKGWNTLVAVKNDKIVNILTVIPKKKKSADEAQSRKGKTKETLSIVVEGVTHFIDDFIIIL